MPTVKAAYRAEPRLGMPRSQLSDEEK